jgi:hypothetical protein
MRRAAVERKFEILGEAVREMIVRKRERTVCRIIPLPIIPLTPPDFSLLHPPSSLWLRLCSAVPYAVRFVWPPACNFPKKPHCTGDERFGAFAVKPNGSGKN